jgi:hypothetical protein
MQGADNLPEHVITELPAYPGWVREDGDGHVHKHITKPTIRLVVIHHKGTHTKIGHFCYYRKLGRALVGPGERYATEADAIAAAEVRLEELLSEYRRRKGKNYR